MAYILKNSPEVGEKIKRFIKPKKFAEFMNKMQETNSAYKKSVEDMKTEKEEIKKEISKIAETIDISDLNPYSVFGEYNKKLSELDYEIKEKNESYVYATLSRIDKKLPISIAPILVGLAVGAAIGFGSFEGWILLLGTDTIVRDISALSGVMIGSVSVIMTAMITNRRENKKATEIFNALHDEE